MARGVTHPRHELPGSCAKRGEFSHVLHFFQRVPTLYQRTEVFVIAPSSQGLGSVHNLTVLTSHIYLLLQTSALEFVMHMKTASSD